MKITIIVPNYDKNAIEEYCQRELGMTLQQRLQQEADRIVGNMLPMIKLRKEIKRDLDKFFDEFGKAIEGVRE